MKHLKTIVALVLALAIAFVLPLQSMAAGGKYVSEVYVAYGKNAEEAKKTLQDKGFIPVEGNLNENGDTYVMMGYKTTDDIRESVTDIAVMNMDGNFSTTEYKEVMRQRKNQVAELLSNFMSTIHEYRANLKAGKARAVTVHDLLNNLTDDDSGMGLGDLFNSETFQDKVGVSKSITAENTDKLPDLLTILMQGNVAYIKAVESLLAVSADTNDDTWIDRFAETEYEDMLDELEDSRPDLNTDLKRIQFLDAEYGELVENLASAVSGFRQELLDYENLGLSVETATEADIKKTFGDIDSADDEEKASIISDQLKWMTIGSLYENLKNYEKGNFAKGELLDFFLEETEEDDTERYYPMAAAFTAGQRGGMAFVSFVDLVRYALLDYDSWTKAIKENTVFSEGEPVSVYKGINREIFGTDGSVAYTDEAIRSRNVDKSPKADADPGNENEEFYKYLAGTAFAGILFGFSRYGLHLVKKAYYGYVQRIVGEKTLESVLKDEIIMDLETPLDNEYFLLKVANGVFLFATVFLAIITVVKFTSVEKVTLKPIPKYFVDNKVTETGETFQLNYQAVECNRKEYNNNADQSGSCADLNADEGKQWLALYVSKNSMAGKPVTPDFKVSGNASAPNGMNGSIHMLGEFGAANLADASLMNYSKLYSAYKTIKDKIIDEAKAFVFFKLSGISKPYDEASGNMTASAIGNGKLAVFGIGGLALGAVLGAVCTVLVNKNKRKKETA